MEATIKSLATKDDIVGVKGEITSVKEEIAKVKYDLSREISETKVDTIKWMFIFWIGQVAAMLAVVFLFVKK